MTEHLPECPILKPCCDDLEFPEHGFCGNFGGVRCLHCMAECICEALRACEERVRPPGRWGCGENHAKLYAKGQKQAWSMAVSACIAAFYDRMSDSDLDDCLSDDEKDKVAQSLLSAIQKKHP